MRCFAFYGTGNPCAPVSPSALLQSAFTRTYGGCDHATGQASFEAETHNQSRPVKVLGAAGLGLSLASSASASTMPATGIPQSDNTSPNQRFFLGEEEMADVSLATFHLFDRENFGSGVQLARGGAVVVGAAMVAGGAAAAEVAAAAVAARLRWWRVCWLRGCGGGGSLASEVAVVAGVGIRGCGGFRGCRGFRGCGCGGCGFGIGFDDDIGFGDWGFGGGGFGGCCASWGACRLC